MSDHACTLKPLQSQEEQPGTVSLGPGSLQEGHDIVACAVSQLPVAPTQGLEAEMTGPGQLEIDLLDMSMLYVYWISTDG